MVMRSLSAQPSVEKGGDLNGKEAEPPLFISRAAKYAAMAALAGLTGVFAGAFFSAKPTKVEALQTPRGLVRVVDPQTVPDIAFNDANGWETHLSDWRGRIVLLNLWATWCGPCKTELPSLDRLQANLGGKNFAVLAVSTDRAGPKAPADYFDREGIKHLQVYNDKTGDAAILLRAAGLPLSIVLNEKGQEIAHLFGPARWDSPELIEKLKAFAAH